MLNPDQTVKSLRHLWRFDDVFSSTVLVEFDKNADLKLDDSELEDVSQTVFTSLAEYNYFQLVTADGKDVAMKPPAKLMANFENDQLIILFESRAEGAAEARRQDRFRRLRSDLLHRDRFHRGRQHGGRRRCRPTASAASSGPIRTKRIAQNQTTLTDAFFNDPTGTDLSKIFATKLELNCKAKG